ncbi:MAG: LacI family DNA-binding transcriptional regulator [Aliishimia sp.]
MTQDRAIPTLDDVAKAAGVSTATVSRCLNAPDRVVESTRKRVLAAVEALDYTPNFAARVMAAKRSFTIGAIIPTMENAIFALGLQAFQEELHARGYTLLVSSSAYQAELEKEQIRTLIARGADGLLLIGQERDPSVYDYLKRQNVPTVLAWTYDTETEHPCVGFDNHAGMARLANEVIAHGHRQIAMISSTTHDNDRARERVEGVRSALAENGLNPEDLALIETPYGIDTGADAFAQIIAQPSRPTAVICGSDVLAVGALRQAREMGLRVPEDVSITGFDDMELASIVFPALTTVHVPHRQMGHAAATELVTMVEQTRAGQSTLLETYVQKRDSLGAPPS